MEQEVREMLKLESDRAPHMDEPPAAVIRRARGRKVTNAIGLTAIVAVLAVGSVFGARSLLGTQKIEPAAPGVVPWAPLPAPNTATFPACRAADVAVTVNASWVAFRPRRPEIRCVVNPFGFVLTDEKGKSLDFQALDKRVGGDGAQFTGVFVENTHQLSFAAYEWTKGCPPSGQVRFRLTLPGSPNDTITGTVTGLNAVACTPTRSKGVLTFTSGGAMSIDDFGSIDSLKFKLAGVPKRATFGQMRFFVVATNPTSKPAAIDPCPSYDQTLTIGGVRYVESWLLNCAEAPAVIQPGKSVSFAMEFAVPARVTGPAQFSWGIPNTSIRTIDTTLTIN